MGFQQLLSPQHDDRGQEVCDKVIESPGLQNSGSSLITEDSRSAELRGENSKILHTAIDLGSFRSIPAAAKTIFGRVLFCVEFWRFWIIADKSYLLRAERPGGKFSTRFGNKNVFRRYLSYSFSIRYLQPSHRWCFSGKSWFIFVLGNYLNYRGRVCKPGSPQQRSDVQTPQAW